MTPPNAPPTRAIDTMLCATLPRRIAIATMSTTTDTMSGTARTIPGIGGV